MGNKKMSEVSDCLVWLDFETTGIPDSSRLLEVGVVVTDNSLAVRGTYESVIIDDNPHRYGKDIDCWDNHFKTGLIEKLISEWDNGKAKELCAEIVEVEISAFIKDLCTSEQPPPLCGSTINFDRGFLVRRMPKANALLSYRNIDVSTIRELQKRWRPTMCAPEKKEAHRALDDVLESIDYLKHYRDLGFIG